MELHSKWRETLWADIDRPWDLIIIGGGITGAGILREAALAGLRTLLVERDDYAGGTSSWTSKLVHGGLRYLADGDWRLTLESVRERQALMAAAPGLVEPLDFLLPMYGDSKPGRLVMGAALRLYDLMARRWYARYLNRGEAQRRLPYLRREDFEGAFIYPDACTDDARLVLRVLGEALAEGGSALNYCGADELLRDQGRVTGVHVYDRVLDRRADLRASAVINATGPWADGLRSQLGGEARLRPLRGSHYIFDQARLPVSQAVMLFHPRDRRPLFVIPWEGATVFGTTDLDQEDWPATPARMNADEADYLMAALDYYFPSLDLRREQALCQYSGVRPVVASGADDPSAESRGSAMWSEDGLLTVTGGKLTTYRVAAKAALRALADSLPQHSGHDRDAPILRTAGEGRLAGRYGAAAVRLKAQMPAAEFEPIAGSVYTWAELRWSARHEAVVCLGDLMLRRLRLGLLLPAGGAAVLPDIGAICREELGWDAARWERERETYLTHWQAAHAPA